MSVQFIGMISARKLSEIHLPTGPVVDRDYIRRFTQAHEHAGFDRILVPYYSHDADTVLVGILRRLRYGTDRADAGA